MGHCRHPSLFKRFLPVGLEGNYRVCGRNDRCRKSSYAWKWFRWKWLKKFLRSRALCPGRSIKRKVVAMKSKRTSKQAKDTAQKSEGIIIMTPVKKTKSVTNGYFNIQAFTQFHGRGEKHCGVPGKGHRIFSQGGRLQRGDVHPEGTRSSSRSCRKPARKQSWPC